MQSLLYLSCYVHLLFMYIPVVNITNIIYQLFVYLSIICHLFNIFLLIHLVIYLLGYLYLYVFCLRVMFSAPNSVVFNTVHYVALAIFFSVFWNSSYYYCIGFYFLVLYYASYNLICIVLVRHREEQPLKSITRLISGNEIFHFLRGACSKRVFPTRYQ